MLKISGMMVKLLLRRRNCRWVPVGAGGWVRVGAGGCRWVPVGAGRCRWVPVSAGGCGWVPAKIILQGVG